MAPVWASRHVAAEAHRADADLVGLFHHLGFELGEDRVGVDVVEFAEQFVLGEVVAVGAVAADADADGAGGAALALGLPDGVEQALLHAFEIAAGLAEVFEFGGQRVLNVLVFAAAAFEDELDFDVVLLPLFPVDDGGFDAEVVARVGAGEGVDGVGAELAAAGGFGDGGFDGLFDGDLADADRGMHDEGGHAGVLADRAFVLGGHVDVIGDDVEGLRGLGAGLLVIEGHAHGVADIGRQVGGRLRNQFNQAGFEELHTSPDSIKAGGFSPAR